MTARRVLLRVVFTSLVLAAGFGAAGVMFASHDTIWRIVGTCAATAVGRSSCSGSRASWRGRRPGRPERCPRAVRRRVPADARPDLEVLAGADQAGLTLIFLALPGSGPRVVRDSGRPATRAAARVGLAASAATLLLLMIGPGPGWGTGTSSTTTGSR